MKYDPCFKQNNLNNIIIVIIMFISLYIGLLNRQIRYRNYVKPWMERKRAKEVKKYKSMEKGVSNLKRYVQFVNKFNKENNL